MKTITTLLTVLALCTVTIARADDIAIPTDDGRPFDLTKGVITSSSTSNHFTDYGIQYLYDGDKIVFTLQNTQDADYYNMLMEASNGAGKGSIDFDLRKQDGTLVTNTHFDIENKGWSTPVTYTLQSRAMTKGKYTLTLTFHQATNKSWEAACIKSIAFKKPQDLKPGDSLPIVNAEFDDGLNGWTRTGAGSNGTNNIGGNKSAVAHFNNGTGQMEQTIYNLPNGLYLLRLNAYDSARDWDGTSVPNQDTYVFLNERMVPMKTAYDETVGYRNIYRWYDGRTNNSYRLTEDSRWLPTNQVDWNEALAMTERFYENCVIVAVNDGKASFGWMKTGNRSVRIAYDHATLTYLSKSTDLQAYARTLNINSSEPLTIERTLCTNHLRERLSTLQQAVRTELVTNRAHAPQAIAEANELLANLNPQSSILNPLIDAILHTEHLLERLKLPFHNITLAAPGTLADQIATHGIQANDTVALKLNGTLDDEDFKTLKTLNNLMEVDLSAAAIIELPKEQFSNKKLLTWVTLPQQLQTIGVSTFYGCASLRDMKLPATLRTIDTWAFFGCISLDHAVIPENVSTGTVVFGEAGIRSIVLPASMRTVPYRLCNKCYDLVDIQFNGQVVIEQEAFGSCNNLRKFSVPEGVEFMMSDCFGRCDNLTHITLPSTLKYVSAPLSYCNNLVEVTCLTLAPPYPNNAAITSKGGITLRVPQQAVDEYQNTARWSDFNVVGADLYPPLLSVNSPMTIDASANWPSGYKPDLNMSLLVNYWGGRVSSVTTRGTLTNDGQSMLSTNRLTQMYNFYDCRDYGNADKMQFFTSLINNGQMRADQITIDLRFSPGRWENISFPFDVKISDIDVLVNGQQVPLTDTPLAIYGYDAAKRAEGKLDEAWARMTADSTLHAGQGYIWQTVLNGYHAQLEIPESQFLIHAVQNANKPLFFRNADVEVKLQKHYSEFAHNRSWNFIGNPYPSFFDIRYMETTAPIIVWDYTGVNERYTAYSPLDDPYVLHPGQAFFIQHPLDQETLVFQHEGRQHDLAVRDEAGANHNFFRIPARPREVYNLLLFKEAEETGDTEATELAQNLDRARFVINEAASLDYEPGCDASKFMSLDATAAHLYTIRDGVRYAIDERPLADGIVRLGLQVGFDGTYTIRLATAQHNGAQDDANAIVLIDHETGVETNLTTDTYTFHAFAGIHNSRFTIRIGDVDAVPSVVDTEQQNAKPLYDLQGRRANAKQKGIYIQDNKKVLVK